MSRLPPVALSKSGWGRGRGDAKSWASSSIIWKSVLFSSVRKAWLNMIFLVHTTRGLYRSFCCCIFFVVIPLFFTRNLSSPDWNDISWDWIDFVDFVDLATLMNCDILWRAKQKWNWMSRMIEKCCRSTGKEFAGTSKFIVSQDLCNFDNQH